MPTLAGGSMIVLEPGRSFFDLYLFLYEKPL